MPDESPRKVQLRDDLTLRHHIAYYTFLPFVGLAFASIAAALFAWYQGHISYRLAWAIPWASFGIVVVYLALFGDYIIPRWTYRHAKAGDFD